VGKRHFAGTARQLGRVIAEMRLAMAVLLVVVVSALVARVAAPVSVRTAGIDELRKTGDGLRDFAGGVFRSLAPITVRTVPWILLGISVSMIIANLIPWLWPRGVLLTLPSFFEIPTAPSLLAAGALAGTASLC